MMPVPPVTSLGYIEVVAVSVTLSVFAQGNATQHNLDLLMLSTNWQFFNAVMRIASHIMLVYYKDVPIFPYCTNMHCIKQNVIYYSD